MYNKYTIAVYAAAISSMLVASMFAISYVQQAAAQGNQTGGGNKTSAGGGNQSSSNQSTAAGGSNMTAGNMTGAGLATSGTTTGGGSG